MTARVHPSAVIDPGATLGADVVVGPFCVVGAGAVLGAGTELMGHVWVGPRTILGKRNRVFPFAVLGAAPQSRAPSAERALVIGDGNVFREHVTVHTGTVQDTTIGSDGLFMVGAHLAHDVQVGDHVTLSNAVQIAGHVIIEDHATFGGLAGVAQRVRVGESAFVAAGAMCEEDVPPFVIVQGDRARVRVLNKVGLRRRAIDEAEIEALERAFRAVFFGKRRPTPSDADGPRVQKLLRAIAPPRT